MPGIWTTIDTPVLGERLAVYQSSPATTLTLPGIVRRLQVVESFGSALDLPALSARFGDPLIADGITLWMEGYFPTSAVGEPVVQTASEIHDTWNDLRELLASSDYEFFTHYLPGGSAFYRKYQAMTTVLLRSNWADPLGVTYVLAGTTSDKTLYTTAEGEA